MCLAIIRKIRKICVCETNHSRIIKKLMSTKQTSSGRAAIAHVVPNDNTLEEGVFVRETGPRSKGRCGEITQIMKVFAWVKMEDGTFFKKKKDYLMVTSVVEESEDRFVDVEIVVGTRIECVKGSNIGLKGCVVKVTPFFYRFEVEGQSKLKLVRKNNARAIVDWKKASERFMQVPDANKKRKSELDLPNLII